MLPTIDSAKVTLSKAPLIYSIFNSIIITSCLVVIFDFYSLSSVSLYAIIATSTLTGFIFGCAMKYRMHLALNFSAFVTFYLLFILEILMGVSSIILTVDFFNQTTMKWPIIFVYVSTIVFSLLVGAWQKIKKLRLFSIVEIEYWKNNFSNFVDFEKHIMNPDPFKEKHNIGKTFITLIITAAMTANIPLLFYIYTGSRNSVILLLVPLFAGVFAYINLKKFGPWIICLYLLHRYELQTGRSFVNADYEKIQELRRTFFLSRWLMKDYQKP
ncbi:hypothetical protein HZU77_009415 [Neisseriaceae bacterium TC5R-5]|nr:hypothetical protein [Neisseriaceae bacterium TC5R-5]